MGDFPILIRMNGTDYVAGGISTETLAEQAVLLAKAGLDAIEISGGMHEALSLSEEKLGSPPVPALESHTQHFNPANRSYFLPYAGAMAVDVPSFWVTVISMPNDWSGSHLRGRRPDRIPAAPRVRGGSTQSMASGARCGNGVVSLVQRARP